LVLKIVGPIIEVVAKAITGLFKLIDRALEKINGLIKAYNSIPFLPNIPTIPRSSTSSGSNTVATSSLPFGGAALPTVKLPSTPSVSTGGAIPSGFSVAAARSSKEGDRVVNNITVNGAIDSEGTARTIVRTINDSFYRGTGGSSQFAI
jgi:hypothetical protein